MKIVFRATDEFMAKVRADLLRPHPFAYERVGFIAVRAARGKEHLVLMSGAYYPVADADYLQDPSVGAMMGQEAVRKALELALLNSVGMFHVHMHLHPGRLWFSPLDLREQLRFVPDFFKVRPELPHGALVLSPYSVTGRAWLGPKEIVPIFEFNTVGARLRASRPSPDGTTDFHT